MRRQAGGKTKYLDAESRELRYFDILRQFTVDCRFRYDSP